MNRHFLPLLHSDTRDQKKFNFLQDASIRLSVSVAVAAIIGGDHGKCDFTQVFGQLTGSVALDLGNKAVGWRKDLTSSIAIMPAECFELLDGRTVY